MTEPPYTRPAVWSDVLDIARRLNRHGVGYVLVGGYALAAHGLVRMTTEVDIAVAPEADNNRCWVAALAELPDGAASALAGEDDPFEGDRLHAIRINDEFTVDVMPNVAGINFETLARHSAVPEFEGERIPIRDLAGLLLTRQGKRPKDQADAVLPRQAIKVLNGNKP